MTVRHSNMCLSLLARPVMSNWLQICLKTFPTLASTNAFCLPREQICKKVSFHKTMVTLSLSGRLYWCLEESWKAENLWPNIVNFFLPISLPSGLENFFFRIGIFLFLYVSVEIWHINPSWKTTYIAHVLIRHF